MPRVMPLLFIAILLTSTPAFAQKKGEQGPTRADLLKTMKPADGFAATVFAMPPDISYPTCLAATPGGDVYVGIDLNGSLGRTKGQGKVVRCRDTNNDGIADEFVTFCEVQHPRGLHFDHGRLLVLHPPFLSAFIDDDGDGKSDRHEVLVKGLSTDATNQRGADHTTNGFRLGIDGWLYIAVGDFGFLKAEGKDGTTLQLYGGGVARVRPDGTELEIVSRGQRNIYDVAVSPTLDLFTRDNTNDGDGWDVRLSHVVPLGNYGYPSLYKNFPAEHLQPLNDFGGGAPCGALYLAEPGFPEGLGDTLYTVEWGRSAVFRHPLTKKGAGYDKSSQTPLINLPSPTDMDVDGSGRLYISSWRGGGFSFSNPFVGFVARLTPPGWKYEPFPDLTKFPSAELVKSMDSPSAVKRQAVQLELLHRAGQMKETPPTEWTKGLVVMMNDASKPIAVRVAAMFTLKQFLGAGSLPALEALADDAGMREYAIRAIADRISQAEKIDPLRLVQALSDPNPRVRLQAVVALARLNKTKEGGAILPLTLDPDPIVAHVAVRGLIQLKEEAACRQMLITNRNVAGSLRVLQELHEPRVVELLIQRNQALKGTEHAETQQLILAALCRLYFKEHEWDGKWWGTRPDTAGPYFKRVPWSETSKIGEELSRNLKTAEGPTLKALLIEMKKHKIDLPGLDVALLKMANDDPKFRPQAVELLLAGSTFPAEALAILRQTATERGSPLRAKAIRGLHRYMDQKDFFPAAVDAFTAVASDLNNKESLSAWEDFTRDAKHANRVGAFAKLAQSKTPAERDLGWAVLVNLASGKLTPPEPRQAAQRVIDAAWNTDSAVPLLGAIAKTKADVFAFQVRNSMKSDNAAVKKSAEAAFKALGLAKLESSGPRTELKGKSFDAVRDDALKLPGDAKVGQVIFLKQGCIACHTVSPTEPVKGPYLGDIAARYKRPDLLESILKPSAKIAQGFETTFFALNSGKTVDGFVVREAGDEVELRTSAGISMVLKKSDIDERGRREISAMPEGLADNLTISELASLVAYLESLNTQKK